MGVEDFILNVNEPVSKSSYGVVYYVIFLILFRNQGRQQSIAFNWNRLIPLMPLLRWYACRVYILRSIVHDIGQRLECEAILYALTRLIIRDYRIEDAITREKLLETLKKYSNID